jgi:5-methylcytosine-specific restriction endonuclease McrA
MNQEQHLVIFGVGLSVDHKDGNGVYSQKKNHDLNNLQTLCIRCHGKKDGLRGNQKRWGFKK